MQAIDVIRKCMDSGHEVFYKMENTLGANPKSDGCTMPCLPECVGFEERELKAKEMGSKGMQPCYVSLLSISKGVI